jgi:hypothetical protein
MMSPGNAQVAGRTRATNARGSGTCDCSIYTAILDSRIMPYIREFQAFNRIRHPCVVYILTSTRLILLTSQPPHGTILMVYQSPGNCDGFARFEIRAVCGP